MKLSNKPTGYIVVPARLASEWDTCDYCLITYDDKTLDKWKAYSKAIDDLKENVQYPTEIHRLSIWEGGIDFFNLSDSDDDQEVVKHLDQQNGFPFAYVTLSEGEEEELLKPEQRVDCLQVNFYLGRSISFIGFGKHTGEEFWTNDIEIDKL